MMRAALAELDQHETVEVFSVVRRANHERDRDCGDDDCDGHNCDPPPGWMPTRSELVSARRALHTLAGDGVVELARQRDRSYERKPPWLMAKRCQPGRSAQQATHTGGAP